ncbi:MAG: substrate-binding domain-containing protein [Methanoregulaceae archaeon]|nr:substrate-binding domain-containing protein [Methanoregulaceae archaeon]
MLKRLWLLFGIVAMLFVIGCGSKGGDATAPSGDGTASSGEKVKIGFLVKSATEPWFQTEWKFADEAAAKYGFELIKQEVKDAEKVSSAIDELAVKGAKGVIICTPDPKLGTLIVDKCKEKGLKLMSVDDRLEGPDGQPLTDVPHVGISARDIGKSVGQALVDEMKKRGWNLSEVGAIAVSLDTLQTARERTEGAMEILTANGFDATRIWKAPWKNAASADIPNALDAANIVLTQQPGVKYWIGFSSNDDGVLGIVRATEQRGIKAENVIGVGINGTSGVDDLKKTPPTGFFASILLSPRKHGYETAELMYKWVTEGTEPAKETWTSGTLITRENFEEEMKKEGL